MNDAAEYAKSLQEDPEAITNNIEDIREPAMMGDTEVLNVVLYDLEEEGIVVVRFKDPEDALGFAQWAHNRKLEGVRLEAYVPTSKPKFRKSDRRETGDEEDEEAAEAERLEAYGRHLEAEAREAEVKEQAASAPSQEIDGGVKDATTDA